MIKSQPLVSVGVPTYNRPAELRHTLEALIGQTYQDLEIIVSDNCSPNFLSEITVREFMKRDSRIKFFRQPENEGALFNFQFVLEQAQGEFFMWAADDDYRESTFIELLVNLMSNNPGCVIAFCNFMEVDEAGVAVEGYPNHLAMLRLLTNVNTIIRLVEFFFQLESKGKANLIYGLMRREFLLGFDWLKFTRRHGEYGADMLFVYSMFCKGELALTDQLLYKCTVGNKKEYVVITPRSFGKKLVLPFVYLIQQLNYAAQYLFIGPWGIRIVLVMLWPIKVLDIIMRIFLPTEIKNLYARVLRW